MDNREYLNVSEINSYIKTYLENNYFLRDIYVKGEISNFKKHQSGTFYFSIKDATSQINVVMFSTYASKITTSLKDGALVLIKGRLTVYEARGSYQIQAYDILFDSIGLLYQEYEKLEKANDLYNRHKALQYEVEGIESIEQMKTYSFHIPKGKCDIVISGLGFITISSEGGDIEVKVPPHISVFIRESLI